MFNKEVLRIMAESERMMDEGKTPWVWALRENCQYDRMAVAPSIMKELDLKQGQKVNAIVRDSIVEMSLEILSKHLRDAQQAIEDSMLDEDFDFRDMMEKNDGK